MNDNAECEAVKENMNEKENKNTKEKENTDELLNMFARKILYSTINETRIPQIHSLIDVNLVDEKFASQLINSASIDVKTYLKYKEEWPHLIRRLPIPITAEDFKENYEFIKNNTKICRVYNFSYDDYYKIWNIDTFEKGLVLLEITGEESNIIDFLTNYINISLFTKLFATCSREDWLKSIKKNPEILCSEKIFPIIKKFPDIDYYEYAPKNSMNTFMSFVYLYQFCDAELTVQKLFDHYLKVGNTNTLFNYGLVPAINIGSINYFKQIEEKLLKELSYDEIKLPLEVIMVDFSVNDRYNGVGFIEYALNYRCCNSESIRFSRERKVYLHENSCQVQILVDRIDEIYLYMCKKYNIETTEWILKRICQPTMYKKTLKYMLMKKPFHYDRYVAKRPKIMKVLENIKI